MTQKKILLKSMRALEFQCPLKFRCQTREIDLSKCEKATDEEKKQQDVMSESASFFKDGMRKLMKNPGSLTPPSLKNLSKRCKRLIFLSIS